MPNDKTDQRGFNTDQPDTDRTVASQGGPATGLGDPANRAAPSAKDVDSTTMAAAASTGNDQQNKEQQKEKQEQHTDTDEMQSDGNLGMPEGK